MLNYLGSTEGLRRMLCELSTETVSYEGILRVFLLIYNLKLKFSLLRIPLDEATLTTPDDSLVLNVPGNGFQD